MSPSSQRPTTTHSSLYLVPHTLIYTITRRQRQGRGQRPTGRDSDLESYYLPHRTLPSFWVFLVTKHFWHLWTFCLRITTYQKITKSSHNRGSDWKPTYMSLPTSPCHTHSWVILSPLETSETLFCCWPTVQYLQSWPCSQLQTVHPATMSVCVWEREREREGEILIQ